MQKKLIALAIAGLSSAAFAQSNVTVYGVMDATFDSVSATGATGAGANVKTDSRVSGNSSFLGFKGTEALGNGLNAVFQVEGGLTNDAAGTWGGANRDTFVGLSGGFGTVVGGNLTAAARSLGAKVDVNSGATGIGYQGALYGRMGARTTVDDRTANSVAYISPSFSGFSVLAAWGAGSEQEDTATRTDNVYSLGLNYGNGPIYVGYAYTEVDAVAASVDAKAKSHRLGGYYKFGTMGQVGLLWDRTDGNTSTSNNKRNAYIVNGKFNVSNAGALIAGYGKAADIDGLSDTGAKHFFLGYEHALSKRTILKAIYAKVTNEAAATYNFYNTVTGEVVGATAGSDPKGFQVGIRHSF